MGIILLTLRRERMPSVYTGGVNAGEGKPNGKPELMRACGKEDRRCGRVYSGDV